MNATESGLFDDVVPDAAPDVDPDDVVEVAVAAPIPTTLSYRAPRDLPCVPGTRVRVPLGSREVEGFVVSRRPGGAEDAALRAIVAPLDRKPLLTPAVLELGLWIAERYGAAPGEGLRAVVPAPVRRGATGRVVKHATLLASKDEVSAYLLENADRAATRARCALLKTLLQKGDAPLSDVLKDAGVGPSVVKTLAKAGLISIRSVAEDDDGFDATPNVAAAPRPILTDEQRAAVETTTAALDTGGGAFVLHGVTGSGKTEVYLRLAEEALARGRGVVMLVPEIALTPQTVERLRARLGNVAVLHSNQSDSARARRFEALAEGRVRVALGPRSALFAPVRDCGVVVVDEEHESTFKQQNAPRYHARDVALRRAKTEGAVVVFGSATPSLEAEAMVERGEAKRVRLTSRAGGAAMPEVRVVDMRREKPTGPGGLLSTPLYHALRETLARKEQALLFLNRLGFSTQTLCKRCGWRARCDLCDVDLTFHRGGAKLLCHYCGADRPPPEKCPDCGAGDVKYRGAGAEKVAEAVAALFPRARVARMDGETLAARGAAERIYAALKNGEIDVLVGTQVVAKGLDVPRITLTGVVNADTSLLLPDFRSAERTFQLLCQVAGRSGRGALPGRVLIQTYEPDHYAIRCALAQDHDRFAEEELRHRRVAGYPPYGRMARVVYEGIDDVDVERTSRAHAEVLSQTDVVRRGAARVQGPAPCPIARLSGKWRRHVVLRAEKDEAISELVPVATRGGNSRVKILFDRDPTALL
jgi:primosomal protein N' (replication factor Y) (superfamily II helicase)